MTNEDYEWLLSIADEGRSCFDCDLFEKCQEENRCYCEKEEGTMTNEELQKAMVDNKPAVITGILSALHISVGRICRECRHYVVYSHKWPEGVETIVRGCVLMKYGSEENDYCSLWEAKE
jgi:hypothetical protein